MTLQVTFASGFKKTTKFAYHILLARERKDDFAEYPVERRVFERQLFGSSIQHRHPLISTERQGGVVYVNSYDRTAALCQQLYKDSGRCDKPNQIFASRVSGRLGSVDNSFHKLPLAL